MFSISGTFALQDFGIDAFADVPEGQRERTVDRSDRLRVTSADDLPQIRQQVGAGLALVIKGC